MGQNAQALFKTPEQVRAERLKQQQAMYASAKSPYESMGMALGNILSTAFGVKDPELERASNFQSIYNSVLAENPDITSSSFYNTLAQQLAAAGLGAEAQYAMQESYKYRKDETAEQREIRKQEFDEIAKQEELRLREKQIEATREGQRGRPEVLSIITKDGRPVSFDAANGFQVPDDQTGILRKLDPTKDKLEYKQTAGDPMAQLLAAIIGQSMGVDGQPKGQPGKASPPPKSDNKNKPPPLNPDAYSLGK
jgi:hypothetical protein